MELHTALRHIIQTEGQDIIKEQRLVNILDDFNAYQDIPASKYILRAIIADGYSTKLFSLGKWGTDAEHLTSKFSSITGFVPESVFLIFQSIAFGLGWINNITPLSTPKLNLSTSQNRSQNPTRPNVPTGWKKGMTQDEIETYFISLTELDHSNDNVFGATVTNLCYFVNSNNNITLSCEVKRINKKKDYVFLRYTLYDTKGRAVSTGYGTGKAPNTPNPNPVLLEFTLPPKMISKIRLYWE